MREEIIGPHRLILGDSLEVMADLVSQQSVHHVISDPPYEDELHAAMGRIKRTDGQEMVEDLGFEGVNALRPQIAKLATDMSVGWVVLFTLAEGVRAWRHDLQAAGAKWDTTCFWIKPDSAPRFNGQGPARGAECFVTCWAGPGHRSWNGGGKRGVYTHLVNGSRETKHPTEKPVSLMAEIVSDFTQPGQTILDPFMGSGTTGVACHRLGRTFIGIEQNPVWFDEACRRISAAEKQADMFSRPERTVQPHFFAGGGK